MTEKAKRSSRTFVFIDEEKLAGAMVKVGMFEQFEGTEKEAEALLMTDMKENPGNYPNGTRPVRLGSLFFTEKVENVKIRRV